jgi:thymidylate kinase
VSTLLRDLADHSSWHRPDVVVVLHVPPTVAATRLAARASRHSRTQALEPGAAAQEIARGADLLDRLVRWWCASADGGQLVEVDAAGPVTELTGRLVDQLRPGLERSTTLS